VKALLIADGFVALLTPVWLYCWWCVLEGRKMGRETKRLKRNTAEKFRLIDEMKAGRISPDDAITRCRLMDLEPSLW
jgi:hypothetical protein